MESYKDFDMESYIEKRMMEITELKERVLYKEIVGNLLKELFRYNENAYQELEERVLGEEKAKQSRYAVYLALTDLAHYDATDSFLYPMAAEDTKKREILCEDVINAVKHHEELKLKNLGMIQIMLMYVLIFILLRNILNFLGLII